MRSTRGPRLTTGWDVYGSDGEKIGSVAEITDEYLMIQKGLIFTTDLFVPLSDITDADEGRVHLALTKRHIEDGDYTTQPPRGTDIAAAHAARDTGYDAAERAEGMTAGLRRNEADADRA